MEVTYKFQKLWKSYLRDRFFALFVIGLPLVAAPELDLLLEPGGIIFVILIPSIIAEILHRKNSFPISETFLNLGMPIGILGTAIGLVAVFGFFSDTGVEISKEDIGASTYVMLVTVFYGFLVSALGFALTDKKKITRVELPITSKSFYLALFIFCITVLFTLESASGVRGAISLPPALLTTGLVIAFNLARKGTGLAENFADASLAAIVMGIIVTVVTLYGSFGQSPNYDYVEPHAYLEITGYACYCLLYGSFLYVFSFFLSLRTNEFHEINFKARNWHMLEAFSFFVFMTLAAPSIFSLV